jgi:hypothetical protein
MHRDKRLGLALGILLLGIVAAFFFRDEGPPEFPSPGLIDAEKLDEQIAENGFMPYLDGLEGDAATAQSVSRSSAAGGDADVWDAPDFLRRPRPTEDLPGANGPPSPIDTRATVQGGIPIPRENAAWQPVPETVAKTNAARLQPASKTTIEGFVVHRVEHGDTLSGLALRYLGNSARFGEIYNANRETLQSPNDLRLGMALRIPYRENPQAPADRQADQSEKRALPVSDKPPVVAPPAAGPIAPAPSPPMKPASSKRFVPAGRSPLLGRGPGERHGQADVPFESIPGRLSQVPPAAPLSE